MGPVKTKDGQNKSFKEVVRTRGLRRVVVETTGLKQNVLRKGGHMGILD